MSNLENEVITNLTLYADDAKRNSPLSIYAKQFDTNSRYLKIKLMQASGEIPISGLPQLNCIKPNGQLVYIAGTIENDGTIIFKLTSNILSDIGKVSCDVSVFDTEDSEDVILTSSTFYIIVDESNYDAEAIEGFDEFATVSDVLAQAADIRDDITEGLISKADGLLIETEVESGETTYYLSLTADGTKIAGSSVEIIGAQSIEDIYTALTGYATTADVAAKADGIEISDYQLYLLSGNERITEGVPVTTDLSAYRTAADQDAIDATFFTTTDNTLTASGQPADAAATGNAIQELQEEYENTAPAVYDVVETKSGSGISSVWSVNDARGGKNLKSLIVTMEPQQAAGTPSPSSVKTITGYTAYNIYQAKGNLYNGREINTYLSDAASSYGETITQTGYQTTTFINVEGITNLMFRFRNPTGTGHTARIAFYDKDYNYIPNSKYVWSTSSTAAHRDLTRDVYDGAVYMRFGCVITDYMLIMGDRTVPISSEDGAFPPEAGTVYGGYIDVINGKLVVTKGCFPEYDPITDGTVPEPWISSMDVYAEGVTPTTGAQVVYDLAVPEVFDITPRNVTMLEGATCLTSFVAYPFTRGIIAEYECTDVMTGKDVDNTLMIEGKAADAKVTGDLLRESENLLINGYSLLLTSSDLWQYGFKSDGGLYESTKRLVLREAVKVNQGTRILFNNDNHYSLIWCLDNSNLYDPSVLSATSWAKRSSYTVPYDCYIMIAFATASTTGSSSAIVPADFTGSITFIKSNYIDKTAQEITSYIDETTQEITSGGAQYVIEEADAVSDRVRNVQTGNSLTFVAVSDMHYNVDDSTVHDALVDMKDAVNQIKKQVNIDFFASFGDITYRLNTNGDYEKGKAECVAATKLLNECFEDRDQIRMIGNHDTNGEKSPDYFTANQLNAFTGIYSNLLTRDEEHPYAGIGYHDFERQKIRVIALDTSFYEQGSAPALNATHYSFGDAQGYWLCQTLDMSDKGSDASNWQIIIVSHIQLDLSDTTAHVDAIGKYSNILEAYVNGSTWSDGTQDGYSYDFNEKNDAVISLCIHGHSHRYRVRNSQKVSRSGSTISATNLPIADIYIANALPGRDNESMDGETYTKTANTAESTAFQILTLDAVNKILYAHHYGAGIDLIVHYESASDPNLTATVDSPVWASDSSAIATVENGTVTPVQDGNAIIYAKSETDNCIECWNFHSVAI